MHVAVELDRCVLIVDLRLFIAHDLPIVCQGYPGVTIQREVAAAPALDQAVERKIGRPALGDATGVDQVGDRRRVVECGWADQDASWYLRCHGYSSTTSISSSV